MKWWTTFALVLVLGVLRSENALGQSNAGEPAELTLVGVIVAEKPSDSVALLRRAGATRARAIRIGQQFEGHVLLEVSKGSARLEASDREVLLFLSPAPRSASVVAPAAEREAEELWVRRSFSRQQARDRFQKEMPVILSETDLSPRVEEGEIRGLGVVRLPDGTLLSETGLLPGDVLVSINGEPLRSVGSLWELLSRFVAEGEIRVVVRRKGELLKLAYAITN
jgi:type II secretion system protein C